MRRVERHPRTVPMLYGTVAIALLVVIAAVALVVTPPSPPAVAEFAPRAEDRIDEALKAQSSAFGQGAGGGCVSGQDCAFDSDGAGDGDGTNGRTPTTLPRVVDTTRVKRCVGNPPRQTEDPQSPPCINYWEGDNGGRTTRGVTRDEIRIGFSGAFEAESLIYHFNTRYEFYGRKLRLIDLPYQEGKSIAAVAEEQGLFAFWSAGNGVEAAETEREAERRKLVHVSAFAGHSPRDHYRSLAPYAWGYAPTREEIQANLGAFTCSSLAHRAARFAGGELSLRTRKFAVLVSKSTYGRLDLGALNAELRRCNVEPPRQYDISAIDDTGQVMGTYAALKQDEVNSLLVLASADDATKYMREFPPEYEPEWVMSGFTTQENEVQWTTAPASRRRSTFGIFTTNKLLPQQDTPSWWALQEGRQAGGPDSGALDAAADFGFNQHYRSLLLLASGIQMAGPRLTPHTFAAGLQRATFPNPGAGVGPYFQAHVGFGPGDYTMTDGASAVWWSDAAPSYGGSGATKTGGWCYARRGTRFDRIWPDLSGELFDPNPANCQ